MAFQLRHLDEPSYRDLTQALTLARGGDRTRLDDAIARARGTLVSRAFRKWNASFEWLEPLWNKQLDEVVADGVPSEDAAREAARVLVPLLCMPRYQFAPLAGPQASSTLVVLGEDDAGLYLALRDADEWFDQLFEHKFETPAPFADGDAMVTLSSEESERLAQLAGRPDIAANSPSLVAAKERLVGLLLRINQDDRARLSVSVEGA